MNPLGQLLPYSPLHAQINLSSPRSVSSALTGDHPRILVVVFVRSLDLPIMIMIMFMPVVRGLTARHNKQWRQTSRPKATLVNKSHRIALPNHPKCVPERLGFARLRLFEQQVALSGGRVGRTSVAARKRPARASAMLIRRLSRRAQHIGGDRLSVCVNANGGDPSKC